MLTPDQPLATWLLDSDPSLRWQVERDLLGEPAELWQATCARVAVEGHGAQLLALQDDDGQWAGGAFFPAGFDFDGPEAQPGAGQPWTATTWSLKSLREWGVDAAVLTDTAERLDANCRWEYENLPYWGGEVDVCINSWTLSNGLWLGADVDGIVTWFLEHQLEDGGWNCEWVEGSTRSSFHSTLNALYALLEYERVTGDVERTRDARHRGEEYLLERKLHRRRSTGAPHDAWATHFGYPFHWAYSALRALSYFRDASLHDDRAPDARAAEAVGIVRSAQEPDGRWRQAHRHAGAVWFEVDAPVGEPSRWLTFHALRVLDWWDGAQPG